MTQTLLTADRIRSIRDLMFEDVLVPEWPNEDGSPGTVRIQEMSAVDSLRMHDFVQQTPGDGIYLMIVFAAVNTEGQHIFDISTPEAVLASVEMLRGKSLHVLNTLQRVALKLNRRKVADPNASGEVASAASPSA